MRRPRLTITLKDDVIKLIDSIIDGKSIRNRSNAIEVVLEKYFSSDVKTAVIISSGYSQLNKKVLKSLVKIKDRAIIHHTIDLLLNNGIQKIIICSDHVKEIKNYITEQKIEGQIEYVEQKANLGGTAKALKLLQSKIKDETFVLIYGDVLANINLLDFINFHKTSSVLCSVALTSVIDPDNWGVIKMKGTEITTFEEKPKKMDVISHLVNGGIFIMDNKIFDYLKKPNIKSLEKDVFPHLVSENKIKGYLFDGQWFDIGQKEMYEKAKKQWNHK